jgi:hypothetical protein
MNKEALTVERNEEGTIRYRNAEGELHNPYGPALIWADGDVAYYIKGRLHNENGPAIVGAGSYKSYWINGQEHNPNGPAVVYANGDKSYFINGKKLTKAEFKSWQSKR